MNSCHECARKYRTILSAFHQPRYPATGNKSDILSFKHITTHKEPYFSALEMAYWKGGGLLNGVLYAGRTRKTKTVQNARVQVSAMHVSYVWIFHLTKRWKSLTENILRIKKKMPNSGSVTSSYLTEALLSTCLQFTPHRSITVGGWWSQCS